MTIQRVYWRIVTGHYWRWWTRGIRNTVRYVPVVWRDEDWDWEGLVTILAFKFERMAEAHKAGHLLKAPRSERQLRIAAHCCNRLLADQYYRNSGCDKQRAAWAADSDHKILGKLISRHLTSWWD